MSAPHLRLVRVTDEQPQALTAKAARAAVVALGQKHALELFDALAALAKAHDAPAAAAEDMRALRENALGVTGYVFDDLIRRQAERGRCAR